LLAASGLLPAALLGATRLPLGRLLASGLLSAVVARVGFFVADALADAVALGVDDFVQLLRDVVENGAQVVAIEVAGAGVAEAVKQLLEAHHAAAAGELGAPLHHAAERAAEASVVE